DGAHDPAAQRGLLSCEHVLDADANFASVAVCIRLRFRQRVLASGPHMNTALEAAGAQSLLDLARAIGAVAEHVRRRVALGQEFVQLPGCRAPAHLSACKTSIRNSTIASIGFLPALLFLTHPPSAPPPRSRRESSPMALADRLLRADRPSQTVPPTAAPHQRTPIAPSWPPRIIAVTSEIRTGQRQELFFEVPTILKQPEYELAHAKRDAEAMAGAPGPPPRIQLGPASRSLNFVLADDRCGTRAGSIIGSASP